MKKSIKFWAIISAIVFGIGNAWLFTSVNPFLLKQGIPASIMIALNILLLIIALSKMIKKFNNWLDE